MSYRYEPTPRETRDHPSKAAAYFVCILIVCVVAYFAWLAYIGRGTSSTTYKTHDSLAPTYTYNGEIIRWYVLIDPETNVKYLVNDRGGCTPRLNHDGSIKGVEPVYTERGL